MNFAPLNFSPAHLSDEAIAACADGALSAAADARAQRHLAECIECRSAVDAQREAARALRLAAAPSLPSGLLERLQAVPSTTELRPPNFTLTPDGHAVFPAHSSRQSASPDTGRDFVAAAVLGSGARARRSRSMLVAAALATAGAAGMAFGAGSSATAQDAPAPSVPAQVVPVAYHGGAPLTSIGGGVLVTGTISHS